jgi:proteasome accessory factor A
MMGSESEYAISCRAGATIVAAEEVVPHFVPEVARHFPALADASERMSYFLANGSRIYGEVGGKIEHATPECVSPVEVARYDKAGERILARARSYLLARRHDWKITIFKNNVGAVAPDETTWGNHESYTCWIPIERAVSPLLGHLVSRAFYAGAGILAYRDGGIGFELSQRARHLIHVTGSETTSSRPLFGTRVRKPSDVSPAGWVRAHLICKDSQRSPFGIYLTYGTTALLFHLLNTGRGVGYNLAPVDPMGAVRAVSQDPWLKSTIALEDGRELTALEIQREYLQGCERIARRGDLPEWASALLRHWRETLDAWTSDPFSLADRLDTACKLKIINHELERSGIGWTDLNEGLKILGGLRKNCSARLVKAVLADEPRSLSPEESAKFSEARAMVRTQRQDCLDLLRFAARLQAVDLSYHELGGLYDTLEAAGKVSGVVIDRADIDRAVAEPPPGARAAYRGNFIREHQKEGWLCDWLHLINRGTGQIIRMADPFTEGPTSLGQSRSPRAGPRPVELSDDVEDCVDISSTSAPGLADRQTLAELLRRAMGRR